MIDWILCLLIAGAIGDTRREPWLASVVLTLEYAGFIGFFTQTPGMWLTRIRCVDNTTGRPVGPVRALIRCVLLNLIIPALAMDHERRGWHDKAARSIMIPVVKPSAI
jgi:uncharacterized RDD family membrane protein YckC